MTPLEGQERRGFLVSAIYGIWGVIGAVLAVPAIVYLFFPKRVKPADEWTEAGMIDQLEPQVPSALVFRRNRTDGWKVTSEKVSAWAVKMGENRVVVFAPECTHLGCGYHWDDGKRQFVCPCHSSAFAADGRVLSGPAPRPLDRFDVRLEGGRIFLGRVRRSDGGAA